jgi:hypothetical protein
MSGPPCTDRLDRTDGERARSCWRFESVWEARRDADAVTQLMSEAGFLSMGADVLIGSLILVGVFPSFYPRKFKLYFSGES